MDELKPCPFCNKPPITTPSGEGGKGLMIECLTEGCVHPHVSYYNHDVARAAWNARPREDAGVVDVQDAARYRWLRDNCFINQHADRDFPHAVIMVQWFDGKDICRMHPGSRPGVGIPGLDVAIDAAMKAALAAALERA